MPNGKKKKDGPLRRLAHSHVAIRAETRLPRNARLRGNVEKGREKIGDPSQEGILYYEGVEQFSTKGGKNIPSQDMFFLGAPHICFMISDVGGFNRDSKKQVPWTPKGVSKTYRRSKSGYRGKVGSIMLVGISGSYRGPIDPFDGKPKWVFCF